MEWKTITDDQIIFLSITIFANQNQIALSFNKVVSVLKRKQVQKHVVNNKNSFCAYGQLHQKYISTVKTFKIAKSGTA